MSPHRGRNWLDDNRFVVGLGQWSYLTLGSEAFLVASAVVLLLGGAALGVGVGALLGPLVWVALLCWIAWVGGPQQTWRRFRRRS